MIIIKKFKVFRTKEVASLIVKTFSEFNSGDGSRKGIKNYLNFYNIEDYNLQKLKIIFLKNSIFFLAIDGKKIIGIIRGEKDRIINLFINGNYHGRGIGKKLVKKFENEAKKNGSMKIKIKASLFAVPFYKKMGYKKSTGIKKRIGIKTQPMKKII
jgi:GNAT superfamily N-acetyltransferase